MMLKIYAIPVSLYCAKLRILLRHKQLEWEEVPPPGGYGSDAYRKLVPAGNLPAMDHDGFMLSDSEAIAEYLNEIFPNPAMLPGDSQDRSKIRELSRFHDTRLEPAVRALFSHIAAAKRDDAFVERQWTVVSERIGQVEGLLPIDDRELTLADCGLPITCTWIHALTAHFGFETVLTERVHSYLDRLNGHRAVADELADYRPKFVDWLASQ